MARHALLERLQAVPDYPGGGACHVTRSLTVTAPPGVDAMIP